LPPHLTAATKCNPWIKLSWGPWKHSTAKKLINDSVHTQDESSPSTKLANYSEYKRAATGEIAANGFRATGLFPCDKNIFRLYDFLLSSEHSHAAPVNHLALVNTSNQPSSISANFLLFTSAVPLWSSGISPVPSLNRKPNSCGGTTKKMSSPYKKIVEATQKERKSNRPLNPKPIGLRRILRPTKRRRSRVCRDPTPSYSDTNPAVPFADDSTSEIHDADCLFCTGRFSEDHTGEDCIQCAKCFRWAHIICAGMEEGFVCESCQG
jgi:hypothetical protein